MSLDNFFGPESVAVFGASRSTEKPGRVVLRNLLYGDFKGDVYPVNPKADEVDGLRCYDPGDVPEADLGIFAIPARAVPPTLEEIGDRLGAAMVLSGGFGESGNAQLDAGLRAAGEKHDLRVWGPNCLGTLNIHAGFNATFMPTSRLPMPPRGRVSILSQSGATVASVLDWAGDLQLGVAKVASYGNQLDVADWEVFDYFQHDPETDVVGFYVEGLRDGRELLRVARGADKPVVVLKAGRTGAGLEAAKSHTGALAGRWDVFKGVSRQLGWGMADGPQDFLLALKARSRWRSRVETVAVVTCGGGFGVMASDALVAGGLQLADLSKETREKLRESFPERVSVGNPVDLTGDATPEMFSRALGVVSADPSVDAVVAIVLMQLPKLDEGIIRVLTDFASGDKPAVVVSPPGGYASTVNDMLRGIPLVSTPAQAAAVLSALG